MKTHRKEEGFILVSVIVVLAILAIIGVAAMFKTNVGTKVSATSVELARAFAAAKAGLARNYADWSGARSAEWSDIAKAVKNGTHVKWIYNDALTPASMSDIGADTTAVDAWVSSHNNIRVYDVTATGLVAGTWGSGNNPQVALWAASFAKQTDPAYPYASPNTAACPDCNIVVYALGRYGKARSLQREIQGTTTHKPTGIAAITNAPSTAYWADLCNGSAGSTTVSATHPFGVVGEHSPAPPAPTTTTNHDWMIEATQAEYQVFPNPSLPKNYNIPSGVAFASNTGVGTCNGECPEFEVEFPVTNVENTSTVAVYSTDPLIAYSGHHSVSNMRVDYASKTRDTTTPNAPDMPTGKLPYKLVNDKLLGTPGQLNFLDPNNPNAKAFDLDALRWAAEQLTCNSNGVPSGKFCAKANALKTALSGMGYPANAPVTGRLTLAEFEYNVANAIPMFGIIRVMYPATANTGGNGSGTCAGQTVQLYQTEGTAEKLQWSAGASDYTGTPTSLDPDGKLGPKAKIIVYGSIMLDYFSDIDGDGLFDPASGEHILTNLENGEVKAEVRVPILVNPALPYVASATTLQAFPGITMDGSGPVNLASPTGGNFPTSEGLVPANAATAPAFAAQKDGRMELMNPNASGVSKLIEIGDSVRTNGGIGANTPTYFTAYKTRLKYYYDLAYATADHADPNQWPIAAFPSSMSDNFCIGRQDCALPPAGTGPNNDGDKFHLLFPSGYMHGWKVALAALNLKADDWNHILDGADTLAAATAKDSTATAKGSPFNPTIDKPAGFASLQAKAQDLINTNNAKHLYFYTEAGSGGYALLTSKWADIPSLIYSGGFMQIQYVSNISGAVYTPGPMSWGAEDNTGDPGTGYFNGAIITGFGFARGGEAADANGAYGVVVFDPHAVDNSNVSTLRPVLRRFAWEQLN